MIHNEPSIVQKVQPKFFCKVCDYSTCRNSQYERHLSTKKHIEITEGLQNNAYKFNCICGNKYTKRQNLYRHRKTCSVIEKNSEEKTDSNEENITIEISEKNAENPQQMNENVILEFLKQNQEFQKQLLEAIKSNIGTHTTNSHNKFNLNVFLNETCKDAFNIGDFVSGIKLGFKDFESFGTSGYVNSISNIFIRELQDLDVTKRPIHCSDLKREVIHVKDNDTWIKDEEKKHMKRAIKVIEHKNIKMVPDWLKANPKADDISTKKHEEYMKILDNSMGEIKDEDNEKNYEKIIKNVSKKILIDKDP
jgi:hypothetical protein